MNIHTSTSCPKLRGFALIATISVMVLLVLIALAMLSLSTISLRSSSSENAQIRADSNARMALMLAIAELQKNAGQDQRITADGSILGTSTSSPYAVGVWESWSPGLSKDTTGSAPDYDTPKTDRFLRWLVSGEESELTQRNWVTSPPNGEQVTLFSENTDGFELNGALVNLENSSRDGGFAWAITQEGTKAKINTAGPELADRDPNNDLQVQPRANVGQSGFFSQPTDSWNRRASRVTDFRQALIDDGLAATETAHIGGAYFTTSSYGLLTDTVNGGLKVDLNLGLEMDEANFRQPFWGSGDTATTNPFHSNAENDFTTPNTYDIQRPLYQPITDSGVFSHERNWDRGTRDQVHFHFPVTAVPTFDTLRSFYRIPQHLYQSSGEVTAFERQGDHIAAAEGPLASNFTRPPHIASNGAETQLAIRPVLDRVMFYYSVILHTDNTPRYAITPIITLWNPYNTAIETEGAVAYPWLDLPIRRTFRGTINGQNFSHGRFVSQDLQKRVGNAFVRQIDPYIFAAITADGNPINGTPQPIRFEPGEVRVFVPSSPTLKELLGAGSSVRDRTVFMRPVDSVSDFNLTGGFSVVPFQNEHQNTVMGSGDTVNFQCEFLTDANFPQAIGLSDTTIARGTNPADDTRGQLIADVFDTNFSSRAQAQGATYNVITPNYTFDQLKAEAQPAFTIEVYHRTAVPENNVQSADLVYTGNPRQSSMTPFVTNTEFQTGPQYKVRMRAISSADDLLQIANSGNRPAAYYGATQSAGSGRTHLSFFEIPRAPLLSLADFQHADLAPTPFSPANQFGNSWASAYVERGEIIDGTDGLEVDHSYLINEAMWDSYFFSGAAPTLEPAASGGNTNVWDNEIATQTRTLETVLREFAENPRENPLRNPRMTLLPSSLDGMSAQDFAATMLQPEACTKIAEHIMVDGAFNINSTNVEAWTAVLLGLRGASFDLADGTSASTSDTPFPRFRDPLGTENDNWQGFRSLTDDQIEELAENIVEEVRLRGPFLSLGEFINRRVEDSELGVKGALQAAIDATAINNIALQNPVDDAQYEAKDRPNIAASDTGIGIPGYLTQADLLKSIAPVITARSDTFIIRTYGEARDNNGNVSARSWIEATVQRVPDFTDLNDSPDTQTEALSAVNLEFGRQFRIVSFRYLAAEEAQALSL